MEESTFHEMVYIFIYRRDLVVCYVYSLIFALFHYNFKYDFHVDPERLIVKTRENVEKYLR